MQPQKKINYMWVMVFVCFMLGFFCLGFCSGNKGMYLAAVTEALGIKRSLFSIGDSIRYLTTATVNLFFGSLLHKLGVRKMVAAGIFSLFLQSVISAVATGIWGFYAAGLFLGIGLAFCTTTMISFVIRRWCKENTGKILGFVLAANGVGSAVAAQVISPIMYNPENPFGYRTVYWIMAACLVVVAVIVLPLIKERPDDSGPMQQPKKQDKAKSRDWIGMEYSETKKRAYFYVAAICIFATGMCLQALSGISAAHMKDMGLDAAYVAKMMSLQSIGLACSKFLAGVSYDRFGMRTTLTFCDVAAVIAAVMLTLVGTTAAGMGMAVAFAIAIAVALPLETIMLSIFAAELFGNRSFAKVMGIFAAVNTAGYAVGNPIANWVFDICGTYNPIILFYGGVMLAVTIIFQFILNKAYKERKIILAAEEENAL